ncbi:16748_t:CDS:2 [Funneliformis mosseae]|uniref:16748_t:CDS:1 n=1 Tax=Funneliformis mosseae TaxID=27381 RepID=A0A9N9G6M2_FUNMO|nr:16748_t:CDS:2 [Funneliformis mosseae]
MDISLDEQFDIKNLDWTYSKCKKFLRFIQDNQNVTLFEKEPGDEEHLFLPMYLGNNRKIYKWDSKNLHDIFVAIFRFLQSYYPDLGRLNLKTIHDEKIREWNVKLPEYLKNKQAKQEAKLQDKLIKEINDKWLPGFEYLYDFEYRIGGHKGDLIFADNNGFLVAVETKRSGYTPKQIVKNSKKAKEQAIKYRNLLMEKTKNDLSVITVLGVCFIDTKSVKDLEKRIKELEQSNEGLRSQLKYFEEKVREREGYINNLEEKVKEREEEKENPQS